MPTREEILQQSQRQLATQEFERIRSDAERFVREQMLGDMPSEGKADIVRSILARIQNTLVEAGEDTVEKITKKTDINAAQLFVTIADNFVTDMSDKLYSAAKALGAEGAGFGQAGRDLGRGFGSTLGKSIDTRFSKGSLAQELKVFERVGSVFGDVFVQTVQMQIEGFRMIGARLAPMLTAGLMGGSEDFKEMGVEATDTALQIRLDTARTVEEIMGLGDKISKLGMPFRTSGAAATQYAIALATIKNVDVQKVYTVLEQAVRTHGQDLGAVQSAMELFTAASAHYAQVADQTDDSIARSLSSMDNLLDMYGQVRAQLGMTAADFVALSSSFLAFVNVSKEMGTRTGMMTQQIAGLMRGLFSLQQTGLTDIMLRSDYVMRLLNQTAGGKEVIEMAKPVAKNLGLEINRELTVVLDYLFAQKGGEGVAEKFTAAMSEAFYKVARKGGGPYGGVTGDPHDAFMVTALTAEKILGLGFREFLLSVQTGAKISDMQKGIGETETPQSLIRDLATGGAPGLDPRQILGTQKELAESALSVQQQIVAETQQAMAIDLSLHGANIDLQARMVPVMADWAKSRRLIRGAGVGSRIDPRDLPKGPLGQLMSRVGIGLYRGVPYKPELKSYLVGNSIRQVYGGVEVKQTVATP